MIDMVELLKAHSDFIDSFESATPFSECQPPGPAMNPRFVSNSGANGGWHVKFCEDAGNRVPDICEREEATSLLGRCLGVSIIQAAVIPTPPDLQLQIKRYPSSSLIRQKCVLTPLLPEGTLQDRSDRAQLLKNASDQVADLLAFSHWIGDEDRGIVDVMVNSGKITYIDNGLCGPGISSKLRGAHPSESKFKLQDIILKCIPDKLPFVTSAIREAEPSREQLTNPSLISRIENLPNDLIRGIAKLCGISDKENYCDILITRKKTIASDFDQWLSQAMSLF